ncbi:DUF4394 domain-containing protein [Streptosporangium sp. NBC_01469]|uniref:DUF4394 domain-containing protein n=1 Tax=Streptosporangium sp. NBC_01469 TaxID=2903898 RepID=UPI002E2AFEE0|nr:DUF4394 domain-containing protein [Streptosporangium sp. NBC_01469]
MRRTLIAAVVALSTVAGGVTGSAPAMAGRRPGIDVIGLTGDQRLVGFEIRSPGRTRDLGRVRGLAGDTALVGIDYRVRDGKLYGVGNRGGVYTLGGPARAVKVSQLTVPLSGVDFGVDFNPAADRLRVISDTGQNLRHNLDDPTGAPAAGRTVADGPLTGPQIRPPAASPAAPQGGPPVGPQTDPSTAPQSGPQTGPSSGPFPTPDPAVAGAVATGASGAGYTNNDLSPATATTLFDVDTTAARVILQSPANAGTLVATGNLRVAATGAAGFDVHSSLRDGVTVSNSAFAALRVGGRYGFYGVNLLTGAVNYNYGLFPANRQVRDIAIRLDRG